MDYLSLSDDAWQIVGLTILLGALGGFASDVVYPIRRSATAPKVGLENRITTPRRIKGKREGRKRPTLAVDLGFIGPLIVGVIAALVAVFAVGVTGPASDEAAQATAEISQEVESVGGGDEVDTATLEDAADKLSSRVPLAALIPLALIGGFAGQLVLETVMGRLKTTLGAAALAGAQPAVGGATNAAGEVADEIGLDPKDKATLVEAVTAGGKEGAAKALEALELESPAEGEPDEEGPDEEGV